GLDFREAQFTRMAAAVGEDEAPRPTDVGALGADAVVLCTAADADLVEQARRVVGTRRTRRVWRAAPRRGSAAVPGSSDYRLILGPVLHTASSMGYSTIALPPLLRCGRRLSRDSVWDSPDHGAAGGA